MRINRRVSRSVGQFEDVVTMEQTLRILLAIAAAATFLLPGASAGSRRSAGEVSLSFGLLENRGKF